MEFPPGEFDPTEFAFEFGPWFQRVGIYGHAYSEDELLALMKWYHEYTVLAGLMELLDVGLLKIIGMPEGGPQFLPITPTTGEPT